VARTWLRLPLVGIVCGKARHWSLGAAHAELARLRAKSQHNERPDESLSVYACKICIGAYHVGHGVPRDLMLRPYAHESITVNVKV
jgi:hypothetical protein